MDNDELFQLLVAKLLKPGIPKWELPYKKLLTKNYITKEPYNLELVEDLFTSPWWITEKQIKRKGWTIKRGAKPFTTKIKNSYIEVYNIQQCREKIIKEPHIKEIDSCNKILKNYLNREDAPVIVKTINKIGYAIDLDNKNVDFIILPPIKSFNSVEAYHFGKFHEIVHSTEHPKRLNRIKMSKINLLKQHTVTYCKEELIAELGACLLANKTNIIGKTLPKSISYLNMWINAYLKQTKMRKNKTNKLLVLEQAFREAEKAFFYILGST
jgi:antirestriction protein ArdC